MLDFAIAITNVIGVGIKSFDDPGSKQARGQKKSQSQRKRAKHHKRAKNSKRSKNQDKKKKNRGSSKGSEGKVDERKRKTTYYDDDDDDEQPADKKILQVESDPWVRNCSMALRSRTIKARPII